MNDPNQLEAIRQRELDITKERILKILGAGANVVLTTGGIDDLCMKYFVEANAMAVRRCKKSDLKNMAKATGGQLIVSMSDMEGEEVFDANKLGQVCVCSILILQSIYGFVYSCGCVCACNREITKLQALPLFRPIWMQN